MHDAAMTRAACALLVLLCAAARGVLQHRGAARAAARGARATRVSTPKYGATTVVQRGDTLYGIAFRNGVDVRDLAAWNGIGAPYTIYPGQRLHLYPTIGVARQRRHRRAASAAAVAGRAPRPQRAAGARRARPLRATTIAPPARRPAAPVASGITWRWPADGQLLEPLRGRRTHQAGHRHRRQRRRAGTRGGRWRGRVFRARAWSAMAS